MKHNNNESYRAELTEIIDWLEENSVACRDAAQIIREVSYLLPEDQCPPSTSERLVKYLTQRCLDLENENQQLKDGYAANRIENARIVSELKKTILNPDTKGSKL